jgi:hypothetical protein
MGANSGTWNASRRPRGAARRRHVLLLNRAEEGHQTRYADARAVLEFVIARATRAGAHSAT